MNEELADSPTSSIARALPVGTRLEEFELGEIIREGSSSIVYAATDRDRAVPVAIAEYMPAGLAQRHHQAQVTPLTAAQADAFAKGLKAFINESRTLARCRHPSLVRIVRLWEANGTAYRAMPHYTARRLLDVRQGMNEPPDEHAVRTLLDALLGALAVFHLTGGAHGKVTPSNILLLADDRPVLLGPGTASRVIAGDRIDALMTGEEPSFAPIEQMVESADIPLRPSVDLYALAGLARFWISGQLPAPAFGMADSPRREKLADTVQRLRLTWPQLHYSAALLDALDSALSIYPAERPKDVAEMRARLGTAPAAAGARMRAASSAAPALDDAIPSPTPAAHAVLDDAVPSSPAPAPQSEPDDAVPAVSVPPPEPVLPDRMAPDLDVVTSFPRDPEASGLARIDDDSPARMVIARRRNSRRIAKWSGAVLVLLALLLVGVFEFAQEGQIERVRDLLGISHDTAVGDSAAVSAPAVEPAAPAPSPMTVDSAASTAPASSAGAATAPDAASAKPVLTEPSVADSTASASASAPPETAPLSPDAGAAKAGPTERSTADSTAEGTAAASRAGPGSATLSAAATAASAESAAIAPPPAAPSQPPTRSAQQVASRAPTSPREVCGPRTQFSLYRCMQTQCSQPRWASHAQCQRLRITDSVD
ncbi:MAG TPA: hypothetical protein VH704_10430 [Casimicrobiaceae bacterium]|nr:hypothetical protein [Casimicrobiaceae bacterium]